MPHRHVLRFRVDAEIGDQKAVVEDAGGHETTWEDLLAVQRDAGLFGAALLSLLERQVTLELLWRQRAHVGEVVLPKGLHLSSERPLIACNLEETPRSRPARAPPCPPAR